MREDIHRDISDDTLSLAALFGISAEANIPVSDLARDKFQELIRNVDQVPSRVTLSQIRDCVYLMNESEDPKIVRELDLVPVLESVLNSTTDEADKKISLSSLAELIDLKKAHFYPDQLDGYANIYEKHFPGELAEHIRSLANEWTAELRVMLNDIVRLAEAYQTDPNSKDPILTSREVSSRLERAAKDGVLARLPSWFRTQTDLDGNFTRIDFPIPVQSEFSLYGVRWQPGVRTNIHNHLVRGGIEVIAAGEMKATNFKVTGNTKLVDFEGRQLQVEEVRRLGSHRLVAGSQAIAASLDGENNRHIGRNPNYDKIAITIHFYPGRIDGDVTHLPIEGHDPIDSPSALAYYRVVNNRIGQDASK
ncbi:MAG: hypothetical protein KDD53_10200 [Bdellovibrionales bacterium]|nr:hypothetical protein [Bdellovibrionales bacterium]